MRGKKKNVRSHRKSLKSLNPENTTKRERHRCKTVLAMLSLVIGGISFYKKK